jgi:hypothetical protein
MDRIGGKGMERRELIEMLESDAIADADPHASTNTPGDPGGMQAAVAKLTEKKTKTGKIWGLSSRGEKPLRRLTPQMQLFVNGILAGKSKAEAYREAYNSAQASHATVMGNANRLLKDRRVVELLGSLDEALKEKVIEDAVRTRRFVMERLHDRVLNAKTESAELKALELMGRAVAMFSDNVNQQVKQVDADQLKTELRAHLTLLENVTPLKKSSA